jgi:predicted RNase H-like nuclease (RuvC/YqgF family)
MAQSPRVADKMAQPPRTTSKRRTNLQTRGSTAPECEDSESLEEGGAAHPQISVREVRSKMSDFSRLVDGMAAENDANKKALASAQRRILDLTEKNAALVEDIKEREGSAERLGRIIADQESSIQDFRSANTDLQRRVDNFADESDELAKLRSMVAAIKGQLMDYITLDTTGSSLITTTGQVRSCTHQSAFCG